MGSGLLRLTSGGHTRWQPEPFMAGSATIFLGERLRRAQWLGFTVSFLGICVVFSGDLGGVDADNVGYAWLLLLTQVTGAAAWSLQLGPRPLIAPRTIARLIMCTPEEEPPLAEPEAPPALQEEELASPPGQGLSRGLVPARAMRWR